MRLSILLFVCFFNMAFTSPIESEEEKVIDHDSVSMKVRMELQDSIPSSFIELVEDAYHRWHMKFRETDYCVDSTCVSVPEYTDSIYLLRLDSLHSAMKLSYNGIVRKYIDLYTVKRKEQLASMIGLSEYYFPFFEEALIANELPVELKYLPVIESALNPVARSRVRACGLWQFMLGTGKQYRLEINSFVDERYDPLKSTEAAVYFLKDLYDIYKDWMLVIAAYNCGPGNVNKAIRRAGGKKNYWDIYYYLPTETRGYVPAFIAAMYAFNYYQAHNITPVPSQLPPLCDTIILEDALHFEQISKNLDISIEELRTLNPQYIKDIIPAGYGRSYALCLPYPHVGRFIESQDTIFACNRSSYFDESDRTANPNERFKRYAHVAGTSGDKTKMVYTVRNGDVAGKIANDFGVRLADLRYWNNLNSRLTIRQGQKLVLYVSDAKAQQMRNKAKNAGRVTNETAAPQVERIDGEYIYYTVKSGENLWTIAKKYPGVSNRDIMRWNGISDAEAKNIKPGKKLKIKV